DAHRRPHRLQQRVRAPAVVEDAAASDLPHQGGQQLPGVPVAVELAARQEVALPREVEGLPGGEVPAAGLVHDGCHAGHRMRNTGTVEAVRHGEPAVAGGADVHRHRLLVDTHADAAQQVDEAFEAGEVGVDRAVERHAEVRLD